MTIDLARRPFIRGSAAATAAAAVRKAFGRPLTESEKILFAHIFDSKLLRPYKRSAEYACFRPNNLIMQDLLAQTAMLQFMRSDFPKVALPTSIHCDHLTLASEGARKDLTISNEANAVV